MPMMRAAVAKEKKSNNRDTLSGLGNDHFRSAILIRGLARYDRIMAIKIGTKIDRRLYNAQINTQPSARVIKSLTAVISHR